MITNFGKKKRFYYILGGIIFIVISAFLIFADIRIYKEKQRLTAQIQDYKKQIEDIQKKNADLKQGISEANNNDYIEKIAREELDLQKPGEKVVAFIAPAEQPKQESPRTNYFSPKTWAGWFSQIWNEIFK